MLLLILLFRTKSLVSSALRSERRILTLPASPKLIMALKVGSFASADDGVGGKLRSIDEKKRKRLIANVAGGGVAASGSETAARQLICAQNHLSSLDCG